MIQEKIYRVLIELTNRKWTSKLVKSFAKSKLSRRLIPLYVKHYKIDIGEMETSIMSCQSLHDFFIRPLKKEARPIDVRDDRVVSPVDGVVAAHGTLHTGSKILVKNKEYSVTEMLGFGDVVNKYLNTGYFIVLYLSPKNYHRIHVPFSGKTVYEKKLGNRSYPVNRLGMKYGKEPLSKNYRNLTELDCNGVHIMIVKVGAQMINTIELTYVKGDLIKGDELGFFSFGSTVVLLFEASTFKVSKHIYEGMEIKMGEHLGAIKKVS